MKKALLPAVLAAFACAGAWAQIITTDPPILTQSSKNITITYHADDEASNKALANLPSSTPVYAHVGLITDKSAGTSDWKYAPNWGDNADKYKLTYKSAGTYTLAISDFKSYFNTNATHGEKVQKLAFVFRTGDNSKEGKTASGGDIFVDVFEDGYNMTFTSSVTGGIASTGSSVALNIATTESSSITIAVNGTEIASKSNATSLSHSYKFSTTGNYEFTANATNASGETLTRRISICVPGNSTPGGYPGGIPRMGPVTNADGTVTFCIAAPGKKDAILVGAWDDYAVLDSRVMKYYDYQGNRYFWTTVAELDPDKQYPYYFIIDGTHKVADPYARLVLDCYSDKFIESDLGFDPWPERPQYPYDKVDNVMMGVYCGNMNAGYKWSDFTIPDHSNLVIYELLLRDFTGTEGQAKGDGSVRKAIEKIPYLKELGVNAVELMPIMEFSGNNSWGYNTNFYFAPDKAYGSPADYKDFVETCHRNGMAVILDIVLNHSDGLHPWYRMYDIGSNPFYNASAPHDLSFFNDWNQDNALVWQQWTDCLKYWMTEYNVDGFRFDFVKGLGSNSSYKSGIDAFNQSRIDNMKRLHDVIKSVKPDGIHINAQRAGVDEETAMANDGQLLWGNFNSNASRFVNAQPETSGTNLGQLTGNGRPWGSLIGYAESHDEERIAYMAGTQGKLGTNTWSKRVEALAVQLLLSPGPKMIWQFGELGANQTTKNSSGNDTGRKKVIWSNLNDVRFKGIHDTYAALCNLRLSEPGLFRQDAVFQTSGLGGNATNVRTMILRDGDKEVVAFINPSKTAAVTVRVNASLLSESNSQLVCATQGTAPVLKGSGSVSVDLAANGMAVFATKTVNSIDDVEFDIADRPFEVHGGVGEIIITGSYDAAEAYNLAGVRMVCLSNLEKGVYIVCVDGYTSKIVVK